jgi:methyl-accepting chemotaxis protein
MPSFRFSQLKLGPKFSTLLLSVFIIGSIMGGLVLSNALQHKAETQVSTQGLMLLQTIDSVRNYTDMEIRELLAAPLAEDDFLPQTVPSYSSRRVFEMLHDQAGFTDVAYKEAMYNPTNPLDLADEFELELIDFFQANPTVQEVSDFRTVPNQGSFFYSARPIAIQNPSCLECHGRPEDAPRAMIDMYGSENGFGWEVGSIAGAQVVYVPAADVFQAARQSSVTIMGVFLGVFAIAVLSLNNLLKPTVIRPIQDLAHISQRLTSGETDDDSQRQDARLDAVATRGDELGQLAKIFQRMVQEVVTREKQLKEQVRALRIEIDQSKRAREVAEITESDYFQDLQAKAKQYRRRSKADELTDE